MKDFQQSFIYIFVHKSNACPISLRQRSSFAWKKLCIFEAVSSITRTNLLTGINALPRSDPNGKRWQQLPGSQYRAAEVQVGSDQHTISVNIPWVILLPVAGAGTAGQHPLPDLAGAQPHLHRVVPQQGLHLQHHQLHQLRPVLRPRAHRVRCDGAHHR